jgi:hypothetical protein
MSDQPGIPAIMVFPPFNPAPRQAEPAPEQAPEAVEPPAAPAEARGWDVEAPAAPVAWDFEAPAAGEPTALEADDGSDDDGAIGDEEDLPWLEVPTPAPAAGGPDAGLKADEAPNWMEWVRDEASADEGEATPIADLQPEDAQPWSPETETAADDWAAPAATDPWQAPSAEAEDGEPDPWHTLPPPEAPSQDPWQAPPSSGTSVDGWQAPPAESASAEGETESAAGFDLPEPELYDLPDVTPAAAPWTEAEAPLFEAPAGEAMGADAEPAWELPAQPDADAPPAWESFAPPADAPATSADAQPQAAASGPFAAVADRLQEIADALRSDPGAFLAGAQGGGDPLGLLVAGFVLGFNARQGGRS